LSSEDALHGLFLDMSVRRIQALKQEEIRLMPLLQKQARVLVEHGGRIKNTERLVEELEYEERRAEERSDLEEILEVMLAKGSASLKQDR
jgi:glutamine phosphoribosylpyrophosphate amidotransferase